MEGKVVKFEHELDFIREKLSSWANVELKDAHFERLCGISNVVYKVTTTNLEATPNPIILRRFGKNTIIDRPKETYIFEHLASLGRGPQVYGANSDYRLEEYLDSRVIKPHEINEPGFRRKLARALGNLHKIDFPKLDKAGFFDKLLEDKNFYGQFETKCKSKEIFTESELPFIDEVHALAAQEELDFVRKVLPHEAAIFCHNDLLNNNILVMTKNHDVQFIDFEYGNYNFRGFDMGNMFAESMIDYSIPTFPYYTLEEKNYPGDTDLIDFIKHYLVFNKVEFPTREEEDRILHDEEAFRQVEASLFKESEHRQVIDELLREIKIGTMLSHYYWCLWAIVMSKNPDNDFDYVRFSKDRYYHYKKIKAVISATL